jgi:hypothetical protein
LSWREVNTDFLQVRWDPTYRDENRDGLTCNENGRRKKEGELRKYEVIDGNRNFAGVRKVYSRKYFISPEAKVVLKSNDDAGKSFIESITL